MGTIVAAARKPLFLAVLAVAVFTGLLVSRILFVVGLIVYVVAVLLAAQDRSMIEQQQLRTKRRGLTSQTFLYKITLIELAEREVRKTIEDAGSDLRRMLQATLEPQTRELVDQSYQLAQKGQQIEQYLQRANLAGLNQRINELQQRIKNTSDQYTREQLEQTYKALVGQRDSAQALQTYIGRITSQLENILANVQAMPAQILRMRASDVDAQMMSSQVANQISDLNNDMQAFVSVLDSAIGQTSASAP